MDNSSAPIQTRLRDGTQVTIRPMQLEDGPAVLQFFRSLPEEDRLFLRDDVTSPQWLERYLRQVDQEMIVPLVAENAGSISGNASLYRTRHGWSVHVGELRVAVARAFQRKGLGSRLARELVRLAVGLGIEKMIVSVVENQIEAKRAFEKLGFQPEAVLKGHVKDIHGTKRDLVIMSNDVSHIWDSMEILLQDYHPELE